MCYEERAKGIRRDFEQPCGKNHRDRHTDRDTHKDRQADRRTEELYIKHINRKKL